MNPNDEHSAVEPAIIPEAVLTPKVEAAPSTAAVDIIETPVAAPLQPIDVDSISLTTGKPIDLSKQRHFLAAFFLSFIFGVFGVDRFYLGKYWTGILKFLTFGGLGVWAMIDLSVIISGGMRDKEGNKLIDAEKYRKFAKRVTLYTTLAVISLFIIITAISVSITMSIINGMLNGGGSGFGLDSLTQMMSGSSDPSSLDLLKSIGM